MIRFTLLLSCLVAACSVTPSPEEPAAALSGGKADDGSTWCHADFTSTGGTEAVFDYQVTSSSDGGSTTTKATPVWINVKNDAFHDGQTARAVILTYPYLQQCGSSCRDYAQSDHTFQVDLDYQDGRFTALAPDLSLTTFYNGDEISTAWFWELAIVVDDQWYKDPSTGNNLRTVPTDSVGSCESGYPLF